MRTTVPDPSTLKDVAGLNTVPLLSEGEGGQAINFYFESRQNPRDCLEMESQAASYRSCLCAGADGMAGILNPGPGS